VDKLIEADHPARGIWELVGSLDLTSFYEGIEAVEGEAGRPAHDPRLLVCLWIYAYSQEWASAREISRRCQTDPACQWLTGLTEVNYHTLADFRVRHEEALLQLAAEVLGVLSQAGLVQLRRAMHDGTKVRADAGGDSFRREGRLQAHLQAAREQIEQLEKEEASEELSKRRLAARQRAARQRQDRLQEALEELKEIRKHSDKPPQQCRASWTDPESRIMKHGDGGYSPSYNVQISTDADSGVIVGVDVSQSANDQGLLPAAVKTIERTTGRVPEQMVVDGGFVTAETIQAMTTQGIELIGPVMEDKKVAPNRMDPDFSVQAFHYLAEQDVFICPAGQKLKHKSKEKRGGAIRHQYVANAADCQKCPFKARCCPKAQHRWVTRQVIDPVVIAFREKMQTERAKQIYKTRGAVAEFSNLWIKSKIGLRQFSVRGLTKVKVEALWACITYNIQLWLRRCWKADRLQTCRA